MHLFLNEIDFINENDFNNSLAHLLSLFNGINGINGITECKSDFPQTATQLTLNYKELSSKDQSFILFSHVKCGIRIYRRSY